MSFAPPMIQEGKRCFVYCGDDRCNCGARPQVGFAEVLPPFVRRRPEYRNDNFAWPDGDG
jgi:hypothetical protein